MVKNPSLLHHLRDILILPFTVTVVIPYYILRRSGSGFNDWIANPDPQILIGAALGLMGLSLFLYTVFLFRTIGKGTLAPWTPKKKLVVAGPYRYCRNPMITGVLLILAGEALFFHSTGLLIWAVSFFAINMLYFTVYEEPDLEERFGEDYREYKRHVPRWMPKIRPYKTKQ